MSPNPIHNILRIFGEEGGELEVRNALGVTMQIDIEKEGLNTHIDCSQWLPGIYFITLIDQSNLKRKTRSIIKL